ncbi:hypothetical protein BU17DRAFT_92743 [Hysterangium stoloniferum]|nr:hypothetical protein BU17DRAFT_92743 [Hysterangium stoloniferum]
MRGNKSPILTLEDLQILKNFAPELGPQDVLTGGQFFAVMRVVCHPQYGTAVDDSLVFVPANPEPFSSASDSKKACIKSDVDLSRHSSQPPPVPPSRPSQKAANSSHTNSNPFIPQDSTQHQLKLLHPRPVPVPVRTLYTSHRTTTRIFEPPSASHFKNPRRLPFKSALANCAQSVKEVLDTLSKERRAEVIRKRGTGSSDDVAAARIAIRSSSSSSISSNGRMPAPPTANPCLSRFHTQIRTHSHLPSPSTITISIPVIASLNAAAAAAAITASPSSPTTPSGRRPYHRFPFADIADQDHHHGRSRERGGREG